VQYLIEIETKLRMNMATNKYAVQMTPKMTTKAAQLLPQKTTSQQQQQQQRQPPSVVTNRPLATIAANLASLGEDSGSFSSGANNSSSPPTTATPFNARNSATALGPTSPLAVEGVVLSELDDEVKVVDLDEADASVTSQTSARNTAGSSTGRTSPDHRR
jgi:hypothetical protein